MLSAEEREIFIQSFPQKFDSVKKKGKTGIGNSNNRESLYRNIDNPPFVWWNMEQKHLHFLSTLEVKRKVFHFANYYREFGPVQKRN